MSTRQTTPIAIDLSEQDVKKLPKALLKQAQLSAGSDALLTHSLLITMGSAANLLIAKQVLKVVADLGAKRQQVTDDQISRLVDVFLEGEARSEVDLDLQRDNARLRANYIKETQCYTASEIRSFQSAPLPKNPSDPAARWKRERRLFAVPHGNTDLFPTFQFSEGVPKPVIKKILLALPDSLSAWQTAFWFASGNGWLDGEAPQDALGSLDDVLEAARLLHHPAVG